MVDHTLVEVLYTAWCVLIPRVPHSRMHSISIIFPLLRCQTAFPVRLPSELARLPMVQVPSFPPARGVTWYVGGGHPKIIETGCISYVTGLLASFV